VITKQLQFLSNETVQTVAGTGGNFSTGGPLTSPVITADAFSLYVLMVRVAGTPTGTSPTLVFALQQSNDQVTWSTIGAALANITAAGVQVTPYATGTTQGAVTQNFLRITATPGGTNAVFPNVYCDLVAQIV
jgi:hypothetical protein